MPAERTIEADEEFPIPPIAASPITGYVGSLSWGGLNKFSLGSKYVIADAESDELINWMPQLSSFQQVPGPGPILATFPAPVIWFTNEVLNGNSYFFALCTNGGLYQASTSGTVTTIGTGFSTVVNQVDIANWQGTQMMFCDVSQSKIFSWNGSVLTTVFSGQPASFIAVYSGRLWMANNLVITWTNAGTNNSLGGDSGSYQITDAECTDPILGMFDFQGSLYVGGSHWWKTINNLVDVGNPPVLTFQQPTLEAQIGIISKWGVIPFGAYLYFANLNGIWQLSGASPTKISTQLDGFFQNLVTSGTTFSAGYATVLNKPCIFWQVQWGGDNNFTVFGYTIDQLWFRVIPVTGSGVGVAKWITGAVALASTGNQAILYGCDGTNVYNMFGSTIATVTSTWNSKIWDFYSKLRYDMFTNVAIQLVIFGQATITVTEITNEGMVGGPAQNPAGPQTYSFSPSLGQWINALNAVGNWINSASVQGGWEGTVSVFFVYLQAVVPFQDRGMGINMVVQSAGCVFQELVISYRKMLVGKG